MSVNKTVLVVEDDPLSLKLFAEVLRAHGYSVQAVPDAPSAMVSLVKCRPDLILLDIVLPDIDGRQLLKLIKADTGLRGIPVLAVSAYFVLADRQMFIALGAADLIIKPLSIIELVRAVAFLA